MSMLYESSILALIANQIGSSSGPVTSNFEVSSNLVGGLDLTSGASTILSTMPNAVGGVTVDFGPGVNDTATISNNIYGGQTVDFSDPGMADIVGRPSIFGAESFSQGGAHIGSIEPSLIGDGITVSMNDGSMIGDFGIGGVDTISYKMNLFTTSPTYIADISDMTTSAMAVSSIDVLDAASVIDGLDFLNYL